jgi:hypothetical protein
MVYSEHDPPLDRRGSPRINWMTSEVQVVMLGHNRKHRVWGWVLDVSPVGFKVKAEPPQKIKEVLLEREEIHFETLGDFFELKGKGRVIWVSQNANTVGISIGQLDEESRKSLYGFFGMLSTG